MALRNGYSGSAERLMERIEKLGKRERVFRSRKGTSLNQRML
jgi:hypothetical protein